MSTEIWAIGAVRNEADIIGVTVRHLLAQGVDRVVVADNGSTDGTQDVLAALSASGPVQWFFRDGRFDQSDIYSALARRAYLGGATWVVPFDADELWLGTACTLADTLRSAPAASAIFVDVINYVQRRQQELPTLDGMLALTRRVPHPLGRPDDIAHLVERGCAAFVEVSYPPKCIARATAALEYGWGSHSVNAEPGSTVHSTSVVCLHAPLRSRQTLLQKADPARSETEWRDYLQVAWHVRRWRRLHEAGGLDLEWRDNSYEGLSLGDPGDRRPLVEDLRWRTAVAAITGVPVIRTKHVPDSSTPPHCSPSPATRRVSVRRPGPSVWGVMVVRDEVDILATNVLYHLSRGVDRMLIADNGSSDGTQELLGRLGRDPRIEWRIEEGAFDQPGLATALARDAFNRGASWVLPIDADEFWWTAEQVTLADVLHEARDSALSCEVVTFVQARSVEEPTASSLLNATFRARPIGTTDDARLLCESAKVAFVQTAYARKMVSRASPRLHIGRGNHQVEGLDGTVGTTAALTCFHLPLRSKRTLMQQVIHGARLDALGLPSDLGWHVRRWRRLPVARLHDEWLANSHDGGMLQKERIRTALVPDLRLRNAIAPFVVAPVGQTTPYDSGSAGGSRDEQLQGAHQLAWSRADTIEGWLEPDEAHLLTDSVEAALRSNPGAPAIVEIGSYLGRSTVAIGHVARAVSCGARVTAIDPHEGDVGALDSAIGQQRRIGTLRRLRAIIRDEGLNEIVRIVPMPSFEVRWNEPIALLFVDGLHDTVSVSQDIAKYVPWVVGGGRVVFHDYGTLFPGVTASVDALLATDQFRVTARVGSLIVLERVQ